MWPVGQRMCKVLGGGPASFSRTGGDDASANADVYNGSHRRGTGQERTWRLGRGRGRGFARLGSPPWPGKSMGSAAFDRGSKPKAKSGMSSVPAGAWAGAPAPRWQL